jgi:hypothetical protein
MSRNYQSGIEANRIVGAGSTVPTVTTAKSPTVIPAPAAIVAIVVTMPPIGSVTVAIAITIVGAAVAVVRTRSVIPRSVKNRDRKGQPKDKMNTSARRRFSEER